MLYEEIYDGSWRDSDTLRAQHIGAEYQRVAKYSRYPSPVTVFGSARPAWGGPGHDEYAEAFEIGWTLAYNGFSVLTGGGPGVMEAANFGASACIQAYGRDQEYVLSLGACLRGLPHEQEPNKYMDEYEVFDHFHARKTAMTRYSVGFVALPGGFGTLDEVFEVLTLMQTGRTEVRPVVLVGKDFWYPMLEFLHHRLYVDGMISREDERLVYVADYGEADKVAELVAKG